MYNEYTIENLAKERIDGWLREAEGDRQVMLATAGRNTGRVGAFVRKVGNAFATGVRLILHPPASPVDIPFGHAG
jgi:hypothetical protein